MGLLDVIACGLKEEAIKQTLQDMLGKYNIDVNSLMKNIDLSKAGELLDFFKKNGVPDTREEITELISKFKK